MSDDLLLILDRRELLVRLDGRSLRIEQPNGDMQRVPLALIGMVVAYGAPVVACDVWRALADRHIPAVLLSARGSGGSTWVGAGLSGSIQARRLQHRAAADDHTRLAIARHIVAMKMRSQERLVEAVAARLSPEASVMDRLTGFRAEPGDDTALRETIVRTRIALDGAGQVPALMGLEGVTASAWYAWLASSLDQRWRFRGRNRRPPRDPVNAMLSLGYTLLAGEVRKAVQQAGLDPALGYLHGVVPGRDSLTLDLMEPLRPGVDAFVLRLLEAPITPQHFTYSKRDGCRLNKEGRGPFFGAWARARSAWPVPLPVDGEAEDDGDGEHNAPDQTLSNQSFRVIRVLRALLGAHDDNTEEALADG